MDFKIISHSYENTGGNTMVSYFQVWLPEEKRTIFVNANEEGATFSVVDFYHGEIDNYLDTIICDFTVDNVDENHKYFEIFRYCINEYIKYDCRRFMYNASLSYKLLSDDLRKLVPKEYHKRNPNALYETDGYRIIIDNDMEIKISRAIANLDSFRTTYNRLREESTDGKAFDLNCLNAIKLCPFGYSLDEYDVNKWIDESIMELIDTKEKLLKGE